MKLLITGSAGSIGSAASRHIISDDNKEVLNLEKLTHAGNLECLAEVSGSDLARSLPLMNKSNPSGFRHDPANG